MSINIEKQGVFYQYKVNLASLSFKGQVTKHTTVKWTVPVMIMSNYINILQHIEF